MLTECRVCGAPNSKYIWYCEEHYKCSGCGTKEDLCIHTDGIWCDACQVKRIAEQVAAFKGNTSHTDEITCPRCGYEFSDSYELNSGEHDCPNCGGTFDVEVNMYVTYSTTQTRENPK